MSNLSQGTLYREADRTIHMVLTRPSNATYLMSDGDLKFSIKVDLNSDRSLFEAASVSLNNTLENYLDLDGVSTLQTEISVLERSDTVLSGDVLLPKEILTVARFMNRKTRLYYTVWFRISSQSIVEENSYFILAASAMAA